MKGTVRTDQPVVDGTQPRSAQQTSSSVVVKPGGAMNHRSGVHERDVCGVDANDEEHENRHGSLGSVMDSRTSQPLVL